jgi:hypothetical protein
VERAGLQPSAAQAHGAYDLREQGETLSKIAQHCYGHAARYPQILEAKRAVSKDANLIFPEQKMRMPRGSGNLA